MSGRLAAVVLAACAAHAVTARAADASPSEARWRFGVEVDLLPIVLSAAAGEPGLSLQLWAGRGRQRLRAVGALIHFPDRLTDEPFRDRETTVLALIYDRFFRDRFQGPWLGAGAEAWQSEIGSAAGPDRAEWTEWVATAGGGWVFSVWRGLTLNPWGAAHVRLNDPEVALHGEAYHPPRLLAEVSLKVGWAF
jgi:hypothetical protein